MALLLGVAGVLAPAGGGALAGRGLRAVLHRMPRGVLVPPGWCETGLGVVALMVGTTVVTGALPPAWLPAVIGLSVLAVAGTVTDVVAGRLPNALTLPALPALLATLAPLGPAAVLHGVVGVALLGGGHAAVHLAAPAALGAGDVKLAAALGGPLGAASTGALLAAPLLAAMLLLAAAVLLARRRLPLGPAMLAVAWVEVVVIA